MRLIFVRSRCASDRLRVHVNSREYSVELQVAGVNFSTRSSSGLHTPFSRHCGQGLWPDIRIHGCEYNGQGESGIRADEVFGGVVCQQIVTEGGQRFIVEFGVRISRGVHERASKGLER